MNSSTHSTPGIKVPPPVIYVCALTIGIGLEKLQPTGLMPAAWAYAGGTTLILASLLIMPPVLLRFRRAATTFDVRKAASTLITDGPYRYSRNPTYVSLSMLYVGLGFVFNNAWILLLVIPVLFIMDRKVIAREEKHLEETFGKDYAQYKLAVRRWL